MLEKATSRCHISLRSFPQRDGDTKETDKSMKSCKLFCSVRAGRIQGNQPWLMFSDTSDVIMNKLTVFKYKTALNGEGKGW